MIRLVERVALENKNTVVVLLSGSVVILPWFDRVSALLYAGLSGQGGTEAIVSILLGEVCPSRKLTETWPLSYDSVPSSECYGNDQKDAYYIE